MNRSEIIQKLNNEYSAKRAIAIARAEAIKESALKNEEFEKLEKTLTSSTFDMAKLSVFNPESVELKKLIEKVKKLEEKKSALLKKLNINENAFEPQFSCKKCKDTGRVAGDFCSCFKNRMIEELIASSGIDTTELSTFANFDESIAKTKTQQDSLKKLKSKLTSFAEKFPNSKVNTITLSGKTGVGKTFALECTANEIMHKGFSTCFMSSFAINSIFVKYHSCFDSNKEGYLDLLLEPDLLVIDDLGTEPMLKNVTKEYFYLIFSERMRKNKATLISTNLNLEDILAKYGERIFSRLSNKSHALLIKVDGDDLRLN